MECIQNQEKNKPYDNKALKEMNTADLSYLLMKKQMEMKKLEKLLETLHCLDKSETPNTHTIFVDTDEEVKNFKAAEYFNTLPELAARAYNRPTKEQLQSKEVVKAAPGVEEDRTWLQLARAKKRGYREIALRIKREKEIIKLIEEVQLKRNLMGKGKRVKLGVNEKTGVPVYKWAAERKK